ncbi:MAG: cell division protein ZapA [Thermodesulfobacteriota bacterium]
MNVVELDILGQKLAVKSDEDEQYIRAVESYLAIKVDEVKDSSKAVSTLDVALLAALNVTGELLKTKEMLESLDKRTEDLSELIDRRTE